MEKRNGAKRLDENGMRVTTRVLFCTLWFLISVALSNLAFAQADDVSGETHRRIEYMMLPQGKPRLQALILLKRLEPMVSLRGNG